MTRREITHITLSTMYVKNKNAQFRVAKIYRKSIRTYSNSVCIKRFAHDLPD